ncbi:MULTISPECIES: hypothetical protein [Aeromonas]|uniref:hypothetical protein n=1 Tax=Aeromonas veronii TaxID=654 RepID=UPI00116114D0|nr:hypothetical protein [Aeromonas veronii]
MEAQTLQQQVPVYHVCQECNGAGCAACSDLLILDGDIQLDPDWSGELPQVPPCDLCPQPCSDGDSCRYVSSLSPINGVIGVNALSGRCDFCGAFSESLDQLKSDSDSSVSIKICPACYSDYVRGGCDHSERDQ